LKKHIYKEQVFVLSTLKTTLIVGRGISRRLWKVVHDLTFICAQNGTDRSFEEKFKELGGAGARNLYRGGSNLMGDWGAVAGSNERNR
jgi:hypothetical protein